MSGTWYEEATVCPGYQCDVSRRMKLSNLLRRMQQIATDQLAAMGEDYLYFYDRGMVFVLTRVTAQIYRQPVMDEKIRISTSPAGIRGAQYLRLGLALGLGAGETMALAPGVLFDLLELRRQEREKEDKD